MRVGVSSRGNAWVSMGCLGWLFLGPFILGWYVLTVLAAAAVAITRAITGTVREIRPEPDERKLERQAGRHRIAGIVVLALCAVVAVAVVAGMIA